MSPIGQIMWCLVVDNNSVPCVSSSLLPHQKEDSRIPQHNVSRCEYHESRISSEDPLEKCRFVVCVGRTASKMAAIVRQLSFSPVFHLRDDFGTINFPTQCPFVNRKVLEVNITRSEQHNRLRDHQWRIFPSYSKSIICKLSSVVYVSVMVFQRLFNDCSENSRYEIVPPAKTIKELESGRFIISDFEVSDEEIPILVRFMRTKQVRLVVHLRWMTMPS